MSLEQEIRELTAAVQALTARIDGVASTANQKPEPVEKPKTTEIDGAVSAAADQKSEPTEKPGTTGTALDQDTVKKACIALADKKGRKAFTDILHAYGFQKISDIPAAQYPKFYAEIVKATDEE